MAVTSSIYDQIGADKMDAFMASFFGHIKDNKNIGPLYPDDWTELAAKYKPYISDFLRGNIIITKQGDPNLPREHTGAPISRDQADEWVNCLRLTLRDFKISDDNREVLLDQIQQKAYELVNAPQ
ncbi:hypothetical protein LLE49_22675 [Alicyclobacillus tolerans]|uniref:globin domain-containing protein n=1 Tax=Alicyclobacillus tolerans TaxID=90970 RepID=UPI001F33FF98|nr:hypothetical protein [Alicyclobacillus tolerans]MCF8567529.1 hypothetical protein [Alicyclobacillus tolerans]